MAKETTDGTCDSWEDLMDEKVLEAQLSKISLSNQPKATNQGCKYSTVVGSAPAPTTAQGPSGAPQIKVMKRPSTNAQKSDTPPGMINVVIEGSTRTAYQPQVRILKREQPQKHNQEKQQSNAKSSAKNSNSKQENGSLSETLASMAKSLEEREALYREARLRILGSAKAEEDEPSITNSLMPNTSSSSTSSSNASPNTSPNKRYQSRHSFGNNTSSSSHPHRGNGDTPSNSGMTREYTNGSFPVPVLRQPSGPEGDLRGFNRANR